MLFSNKVQLGKSIALWTSQVFTSVKLIDRRLNILLNYGCKIITGRIPQIIEKQCFLINQAMKMAHKKVTHNLVGFEEGTRATQGCSTQ